MILADKIINERKKNGWSQEELAEQLSVSRQSVSKWEGAQAVPDLQKIIAMAEIFGVTTDFLLKDEIESETRPAETVNAVSVVSSNDVRRVTLEEANEYLDNARRSAPVLANAVALCILSPVVLIFLCGFTVSKNLAISEGVAAAAGLIVLFAMIAVAVYIFIMYGSKLDKFNYIGKEVIETAYGVDGVIRNRKDAIEGKRNSTVALGIILCIISPIPLVVTACITENEQLVVNMVCVLLVIIAFAVRMLLSVKLEWEAIQKLLQEGDFTANKKQSNKKIEKVGGIYWSVMVCLYLGWSFVTGRWDFTWIVWPIAGVLFGVISAILHAVGDGD